MTTRISTAVAAGALAVSTLLTACGSSTTPQGSSPAPAASSAAAPSTTAAAATPSASTRPSDETEVRATAVTFVKTILTFDSSKSYGEYRDNIKPLMSTEGFDSFEAAGFEQATQKFRSRFGKQARSTIKILGTPKVSKLTNDSAAVEVKFGGRVEQRRDGKWQTIKTNVDDTLKVPLVKQGERWLVDDLS